MFLFLFIWNRNKNKKSQEIHIVSEIFLLDDKTYKIIHLASVLVELFLEKREREKKSIYSSDSHYIIKNREEIEIYILFNNGEKIIYLSNK